MLLISKFICSRVDFFNKNKNVLPVIMSNHIQHIHMLKNSFI